MAECVGVSFDGVWTHARKAFQHMAVLIDSYKQKVVAPKSLFKEYRNHPGNYINTMAGNLMEVNALRLMEEDLHNLRIAFFKSDGDIKIKNFIKKLKRTTPLKIIKNPGHVMLSIHVLLKYLIPKITTFLIH